MTQRIFDVENEKDMADLWHILPDDILRIYTEQIECFDGPRTMIEYLDTQKDFFPSFITINWHDKTEITRPIQEATEADIGKLCYFWDFDEQKKSGTGSFGKLCIIDEHNFEGAKYQGQNIGWFFHCRRLTKQEIEELI